MKHKGTVPRPRHHLNMRYQPGDMMFEKVAMVHVFTGSMVPDGLPADVYV
jgi:hypothetical protein